MTEETMKKELNVTEVLDRVKALDNYDKRELFAGRGYKLYYVTDGDFGCLPEAVMHQCIRIFLNQHCVDGSLELPEWIASLPQKTMYAMTRRYLEYMIGNDSYYCDREFKEDTVLRLLRCIPYQYGADAPNSVSDRTIEQFGWAESIMYRVFYNLLGRIDNSYLIIYNEFMRNKNRSSLEYNCVAKYSTQTEHRLVFEYFPIIDEIEDFMILADLDSGQAYKGIGVNDFNFENIKISGNRREIEVNEIKVPIIEKDKLAYRKKALSLFDNLGNKDPDTVPRELHIWSGKLKKSAIDPEQQYIARNARFKLPNVTTYKEVQFGDYVLIDFPARQLELNDYLRITGNEQLNYLSSGLPIDKVYLQQVQELRERSDVIYGKAGIYAGECKGSTVPAA